MAENLMKRYKKLIDLMPGHWAELKTTVVGEINLQPANARRIITEYTPLNEQGNNANRPIIKPNLGRIEGAQLEGTFVLTGETVIFDKTPRTIDGNHRLTSCAETGLPMPLIVVIGVGQEAFEVIDQGAVRRVSDILQMIGRDDAGVLSSGATSLWYFLKSGVAGARVTKARHNGNQDLLRLIEQHGGLAESASLVNRWKNVRAITRMPGLVATLHYVFQQCNAELAEAYFAVLDTVSGANVDLPRGSDLFLSPVVKLREKLVNAALKRERFRAKETAALFIKAWNYAMLKQPVDRLQWNAVREAFPRIEGLSYSDEGTPVLASTRVSDRIAKRIAG